MLKSRILEKYNFTKLNQEEMENLNRPTTSMEIETVIKNLPTNKSPGLDGLTGEFYQTFREELMSILRNSFKTLQRKKHFQTHSIRPPSPWFQNQAKTTHKKEHYKPISLMNIEAKILNKILANRIQQHIKNIIHHDQVEFIPGMQGFFNVCKSINVIHHTNKLKDKTIW